jgi:hypothetical protein
MAIKSTKTVTDTALRNQVFELLDVSKVEGFQRINDRQYGILLLDVNGVERYVRLGAIVAEEREDMTARELMQKEIDEYNAKQADKAQKAAERAEKAARDKAEREAKKKEKEAV